MKTFPIAGAIGLVLTLLTSTTTFAKRPVSSPAPSASASNSPAEAAPAKSRPFHGMIASVDARDKTFTINGKKDNSRVFKISDQSVITKTGTPATLKDIVENEEVRGSYWKEADGSLLVRSIKLGPLTEQEKKAEEARKARRAEKKAARAAAASSVAASASASPTASPKP